MPGKGTLGKRLARHRCPSLLKGYYCSNRLCYNRQDHSLHLCVCLVLMASGAGANAIVRPNCLQSGTGEIQALAQNGGTISAPPNWTIRTVSGVLLTPGVFPTLPMLPPLPTPPAGGLGGVGF